MEMIIRSSYLATNIVLIAVHRRGATLMMMMVYDVKKDKLVMSTFRYVDAKDSDNIIGSHIYDIFLQIVKQK